MDLRFTPEQEQFRQEVRDFLKKELPENRQMTGGFEEEHDDESWRFALAFEKKLGAKGWLTLSWPKEYGGQGRSEVEQLIYTEEIEYHRAPNTGGLGVSFVGPTIMVYGSEEQKQEYLPKIARAEIVFCQGFSEPNSGSDLASLQTRATKDGDDYIVNGEKVWTTLAHRATYCWLGARTDLNVPKHRGISMFIVPMNAPGVQVLPLINIAGAHHFNQMIFQDVRVAPDCLIGEENRGWYIMATTLDFERTSQGHFGYSRRSLEELVQFAKETRRNGRPLAASPAVRNRLTQLAIEVEVGRMMAYRVASMLDAGQIPNAEASMLKLFGAEVAQRIAQLGIELAGLYGQLEKGSKWAPLGGSLTQAYFGSFGNTIAAGTSEIQRNVIATRGLGLPR